MKKTIILIFLSFQIMLSAQDIIPIPVDTTSVWKITRGSNSYPCAIYYESTYYIDGTVINGGKEYYKVYEEGYYWETFIEPGATCNYSYYYSGVFRGAVMTENGKTYGYTTGSPHLLMDFTLNVGDTLNSYISDGFIINSIDSVLVGDTYRKRFNMTNYMFDNAWMIEGIGHQRGLFESMDPWGDNSTLICYGENYTPLFGDMNCDITVGQIENPIHSNNVIIYPNPTSGKLTIEISDMDIGVKSFILSDIYGKVVLNENTELLQSNFLEINLENFKQGVYLLNINLSNNKTTFRKIIKK